MPLSQGQTLTGPQYVHGSGGGTPGSRNFSPVSKAKIAQNSIWSWCVGTAEELLALVLDYSPAPRCARVSKRMSEVGIDGVLKVKYRRGWIGQGHVQRPRSRHLQGVCRNVGGPDGIEKSIPLGSGSGFQTLRAKFKLLGP